MTSRWASAEYALGVALMHRDTAADRERGQQAPGRGRRHVPARAGSTVACYRWSTSTGAGEGSALETAMRRFRSMRAAVDDLFQRGTAAGVGHSRDRVFWWRHCWTAAPRVTWPKPRPRSSGWRPRRPTTVGDTRHLAAAAARAAGRARGDAAAYRGLPGVATATWRNRLASKDISRGPRR